ncbi:MAG TPA: ATP-binding cassette domain-containing protein [Saprospiraceae bacterium]|nr:ATP-binding cassette domain-containing protein [Saprospiraceae bacterium]HPI07179.1 ATP-binding cassette domain-containing protein [Saprospiraceae bacterium]
MLSVNDVALQFGKRVLFDEVNLKFVKGNCYGVIGANGAGKSTFLKILSGEIESTRGKVEITPGERMAVLSQNHFEFDQYPVMDTVIMGHRHLYDIMKEKNAIYDNPNASEADSMRAAELEGEFGEMNGWMAESDAAELLSNLGVHESLHYKLVGDLDGSERVKVLLAQALFGAPDILLMDEPTNDLDAETTDWLCNFLADYQNIVIVVSHDRHFLDMVCTNVVDVDFGKIRMFTGNYTFWYETSQLLTRQMADKNKKVEQKRQEMMDFIARFSANASKSRQATSRKKALEKLNLEDMQVSMRRYPYIAFKPERDPGDIILEVEKLGKKNESGEYLFRDLDLRFNKGEKIAVLSRNAQAITAFFNILAGEDTEFEGRFQYGQTISPQYLPNDNTAFFSGDQDMSLMDWLRQFSKEKDEPFIRGFLGRMLFGGEEVFKRSGVLSGGEKVRCMMSKIMLANPNFLILDEPTNHLDLESITALNNGMKDFTGNMLFSSHDYQILESVANRIIEITPNGLIDQYMEYGDYIHSEKIRNLRTELYGDAVHA